MAKEEKKEQPKEKAKGGGGGGGGKSGGRRERQQEAAPRGPHAGAGRPVPPPRLRIFYAEKVRAKLMEQLSDSVVPPTTLVTDLGIVREQFRREEALQSLPSESKRKLHCVSMLKLLFVGILVVEVIILRK